MFGYPSAEGADESAMFCIGSEIESFALVLAMIIQFFRSVVVASIAPVLGPDAMVIRAEGSNRRSLPNCVGSR